MRSRIRRFRRGWAIAATTILGLATGCGAGDLRPSILFVSLDTLRADYLNLYGYQRFETSPFLDQLSGESLVFDGCIVNEPQTLKSHASLFTGLEPHHHGVQEKIGLRLGTPTLASVLRDQGYATAAFADDGYLHPLWRLDQGFDVYVATEQRGVETILDEAREWLAGAKKPFFLFLHTMDVHSQGKVPHYPSPEPFAGMYAGAFDSRLGATTHEQFAAEFAHRKDELSQADIDYIRASYAEGVRHVDDRLRLFFDDLERDGLADELILVVWSDHGEGLFDHEIWAHGEVYDHTIRCVLMMRLPGVPGGRRIRSVVSGIDIAPTLLELVGSSAPPGIDGRSFVPLLDDDPVGGEAFSRSLSRDEPHFSIRTPAHHLIWDRERYEFFDLAADPGETRNLSPSGSPVEDRLRARLQAWVEGHDAALRNPSEAPAVSTDDQLEEQLRQLGYVE